ncbi:hypothetical protein [Priestia endophytica]|uniref:hypothetical protein n=1 Tax=Priestia endophytica TaxID=135735 RepID=UPI00228050E8|nr:hypothetical protein [Priestia endophytica]MCY8234775.1 hypothetical protein [Priestia endophytica]
MMMDKLVRVQAVGLFVFAMMFAFSFILPSASHAENSDKVNDNVIIENKEMITINGVEYSKDKDLEKFNRMKELAKYTIVDTDGKVYGYSSKTDYEKAQGNFSDKWKKEQAANSDLGVASAPNVSEFYSDANFQGFLFQQGVGFEWNIPDNDTISSMKTAGSSSGTQVCYDSFRGEPCKTFPPGQDIPYVGDGWNDQISYVNVLH